VDRRAGLRWLSLLTPHKFAFGFAYDFPFAAIVAAVTLIGLVFTGTKSASSQRGGLPPDSAARLDLRDLSVRARTSREAG
jgi:hypothetical protein